MAKSSWRDAKGIRWLPEARRMALPDAERAEYDAALAEEVRKRKAARRSVKAPWPTRVATSLNGRSTPSSNGGAWPPATTSTP